MDHVYLDACAVNRITDDQAQPRVRAEADAVLEILRLISIGDIRWSASEVLAAELLRNPDHIKLEEALGWLKRAGARTPLNAFIRARAASLITVGYGLVDALHLAFAEHAGVKALITTDDRFLRRAQRGVGNPAVRVINPVDWLQERQP